MKKLLIFLCLAAIMPALTGCTKSPDFDNEPASASGNAFTLVGLLSAPSEAEEEGETRTELTPHATKAGTYYAHWTAGDRIAVYTGKTKIVTEILSNGTTVEREVLDEEVPEWTTYTLKEGSTGTSASFEGARAATTVPWYNKSEDPYTPFCTAVYPIDGVWHDGESPNNNSKNHWLGGEVPVEQTYHAGNIAPGTLPMIGVWKPGETSIVFKHIGALVHLQVYAAEATTLSKVSIASRKIKYYYSGSTKRVSSIAGQAGVCLSSTLCDDNMYANVNNRYTLHTTAAPDNGKYVDPNYQSVYSVSLNGPIELSTKAEEPTDLWIVVCPGDYAEGFTVTLQDVNGKEMEKILPPVAADGTRYVQPGRIYRLPAFAYAGTDIDRTTHITRLEASCNEPKYLKVSQGTHTDGLPIIHLEMQKSTVSTSEILVEIDRPLEGVLIEGVPRTTYYPNVALMVPTPDGNFQCQGGGIDPQGVYHFFVQPTAINNTNHSLETTVKLETDAGQVLGYIYMTQVSTDAQVEYLFPNVVLTTESNDVRMTNRSLSNENFYCMALMDEDFAGEINLHITPGRNNVVQQNGIALTSFDYYGKTDWQKNSPDDFVSFQCFRDPAASDVKGTLLRLKPEANTGETARYGKWYWCVAEEQSDPNGDYGLGSLEILQFGTNTYATTGFHLGTHQSPAGTLAPEGDPVGQLNLNDGTAAGSGVVYHSYRLTLATGAAVQNIAIGELLGLFDGDTESGGIANVMQTPSWLTCTGAPTSEQDRSYVLTLNIEANGTGATRVAELEIIGVNTSVVFGKLLVEQPAQ